MNSEIFGSILVLFSVTSDDEAIEYVKNVPGTPLAIYVFTSSSQTFEKIANSCPSGGIVRNDTLVHFATTELPFGGLGSSGYGVAHGFHGFKSFSHSRAVLNKPCSFAFEYAGLRYAPYSKFSAIGGSGNAFAFLLNCLPSVPPVARITKVTFLLSLGFLIALLIDPPRALTDLTLLVVVISGGTTLLLRYKRWGEYLKGVCVETNNVASPLNSIISRRSSAGFMHANDTNSNVYMMDEADEKGDFGTPKYRDNAV